LPAKSPIELGVISAALDSVGGLYEVLAYALLKSEDLSEISETWSPNQKVRETIRGQLESGRGLGVPSVGQKSVLTRIPEYDLKAGHQNSLVVQESES
jgi:hypothetical protein